MTSANRDTNLISLFRQLVTMLQDFYAERLGALYIIHLNWFFWAMYQVIKPFLSSKTKEKIHILKNLESLQEFFEPNSLLKDYGGLNEHVHPYPKTS